MIALNSAVADQLVKFKKDVDALIEKEMCIRDRHKAVEELAGKDTFRGYGPEHVSYTLLDVYRRQG